MEANKKYTFRIKLVSISCRCYYKLQVKKWYGWKTLSIWERLEGAMKEQDFLEKTEGFVI